MALLNQKSCLTCHSLDGRVMVGPTFKGLYGRVETIKDASGQERDIHVDETRLAKAIQAPNTEIVKGYPPVMPSVQLSEIELNRIIGLIKSLK
jgi:cytochrome c oxidase subunit 2